MSKLLPLVLLACTITAKAQTVSFSLVSAPCNSDGVLTANFTGLTPPVTVTWNTYGTTAVSITHTVTGTSDALTNYSGGPVSVYATNGITAASNYYGGAAPFNYTLTTTPAACPMMGSTSVAVTGGTAPYTYSWFNKATDGTVGSSATIAVPTGDYGVTITDAAGCKYGSRVNNDGTSGYVYYIAPYTATLASTPANCKDGSATVSALSSGATAPISYLWSNGATTPSISSLTQGTYTVWVTDALGCHPGSGSPSVDAPASVGVAQAVSVVAAVTPVASSCAGSDGSVSVVGLGGTPPYTYLWSNGASTAAQGQVQALSLTLHQ